MSWFSFGDTPLRSISFTRLGPDLRLLYASSSPLVRLHVQRLQQRVWPTIACTIKVVLHYRDLGAHICTGSRMVAPTFRDRLVAGTTTLLVWLRSFTLPFGRDG